MTRENKSRYALLGLLSIAPMSGYDLRRMIDQSVIHFWNESFGQIYPMLTALASEGLVEGRQERRPGRPARTVYTITPTGLEALRAWLAAAPEPERKRDELLLKLFFMDRADPMAGARHVRDYQARLSETQRVYENIRRELTSLREQPLDLPYWLITLNQGRHVTRALLAWCDETLETLDELSRQAGGQGAQPQPRKGKPRGKGKEPGP